jgi:hypothetical protein
MSGPAAEPGSDEAARAARLVYGVGMGLAQAVRLRIKDIDFDSGQLTLRGGGKVRRETLPPWLAVSMQAQCQLARDRWRADRLRTRGPEEEADLTSARAALSWSTYWLFPSSALSRDPRTGGLVRSHMNERRVQRELKLAAARCGLRQAVTAQQLRQASQRHQIEGCRALVTPAPVASEPPAVPLVRRPATPAPGLSAYRRRSIHEDTPLPDDDGLGDGFLPPLSGRWTAHEPTPVWQVGPRARWHRSVRRQRFVRRSPHAVRAGGGARAHASASPS